MLQDLLQRWDLIHLWPPRDTASGGGSAYSVVESMTPVLYHTPGLKQQGGILQSISCEILDLQDATYPGAK